MDENMEIKFKSYKELFKRPNVKASSEGLDSITDRDEALVLSIINYVIRQDIFRKRHYQKRIAFQHDPDLLRTNVKIALEHMVSRTHLQTWYFFKDNYKKGKEFEKFKEMDAILRKRGRATTYSGIQFLKYCVQMAVLAGCALDQGYRNALEEARKYIFELIRYYRKQKTFPASSWIYMNGIAFHYLIDNDLI